MSRDTGFSTWRLVVGVVFTSCLLVSFACAADQSPGAQAYSYQKEILARVGAVQGDSKVQRAGEAKFKKISAKSPLYLMDFVATGSNSKLWWQGTFNAYTPSDKWKPGPDVTHGSLGADSVFGFKQFQRAGASYRFIGYVQKGTVRFIKTLPNTYPPSTFVIGTHTAWIEVLSSDRAADFIVESKNETLTTVTVLWGKVRVRNVSPEIKESRILTSCQEVDVEKDQEPVEIKWVSTDTMKELVKRTTIPKTLPEDVPSCERLKTEVILDLTEVYLPPPGVALFPVVPVPVPVPGDKAECCPPGKIYDPRTGKCVCPCPEGERPPVTVNGTNGLPGNGRAVIGPIGPGPCGPCRRGATFNRDTCSCECPCPQGFLLPGQGCVRQCPAGYSETVDSSSAPPYRCLYCVPTGVVTDPIPPPLKRCRPDSMLASEACSACEACVDGVCVPRICREGSYLNPDTCVCDPITNFIDQPCAGDAKCSDCRRCRNGRCRSVLVCPERERLNPDTCKCEPLPPPTVPTVPEACFEDSECGDPEYFCKRDPNLPSTVSGTCVRRPPLVPEMPEMGDPPRRPVQRGSVEETPRCQSNSDCPQCQTCTNGQCAQRICPAGQRMNLDTCQCEPVPVPEPQCHNNNECPLGEICRKGKCVKKPPPVKARPREVTIPDPIDDDPSIQELRRELEGSTEIWGPQLGIGIGGGGGVGSRGGGQRVAPVQRIPRQQPARPR